MSKGSLPGCFCYIVECSDGSFYTGWTTDPEARIRAHNAGRGSRYTRTRRPVHLVLVERLQDRRSAMKRERSIKAMSRQRKLGLIANERFAEERESRRRPRRIRPVNR